MSGRLDLAVCALCALPGLGLAVATSAGWVPARLALALFALSYVGLNLAHFGATWARVYGEPGFAARRPVERIVLPALLVALALAVDAVGLAAWLLAAQFYLSFFHGLMQNYGIARAAQRRVEGRAALVDMAACLLLPMAALMWRAQAVSGTYNGVRVLAPPVPAIILVAALGAAALAAYIVRETRALLAGEPVHPLGPALILGVNGLWSAALIALDDPLTPFYAIASAHYVQYVWFVGRRLGPRRPLRWSAGLFVGAGAAVAALTLVVIGLRALSGGRPADDLPPWAAAVVAVNLEHYWLDARIWRRGA